MPMTEMFIYTEEDKENSVINDLNTYYSELWNNEVTDFTMKDELLELEEGKEGKEGQEELLGLLQAKRAANEFYLEGDIDLEENSNETNKISLIYNPIQRFKKAPTILQTMNRLMLEADDLIILQSPYLIWNSELQPIIQFNEMQASTHILTNSETSTSNPAVAGFLNLKDQTLPAFNQVYGFQGDGSIHVKSYVIDNRLSLIGSFNIDPRSSFLSTENLVIIDSPSLAEELSNNILFIDES